MTECDAYDSRFMGITVGSRIGASKSCYICNNRLELMCVIRSIRLLSQQSGAHLDAAVSVSIAESRSRRSWGAVEEFI